RCRREEAAPLQPRGRSGAAVSTLPANANDLEDLIHPVLFGDEHPHGRVVPVLVAASGGLTAAALIVLVALLAFDVAWLVAPEQPGDGRRAVGGEEARRLVVLGDGLRIAAERQQPLRRIRAAVVVIDAEDPDRIERVQLVVQRVAAILGGEQRLAVGKREVV